MKQEINPTIVGVVIALVVVIAGFLLWRNYVGPRTDGPAQPISMAEKMGAGAKMAPPQRNGPMNMGTPKQ